MDQSKTIPFKDQVVVINSLDNDFIDQASTYCQKNSIEYHVTESDGTAATGKNSLIKVFLESDNEYMVQVDGDDEISEYGYQFYKNVAKRDNPPDMIIIYYQWQLQSMSYKYNENGDSVPTRVGRTQPSLRFAEAFRLGMMNAESIAERLVLNQSRFNRHGVIPPETVKLWSEKREMWEKFAWDHGEGSVEQRDRKRDAFQRMVFYSRKAAENIKFDNSIKIGEDFMAMLHMKKLHKEGKIRMMRHNEDNDPSGRGEKYTYLYHYDRRGVVRTYMEKSQENPEYFDYTWYIELDDYMTKNNIVEKYKDIIQNEIPDIV